MFGKYITAPPVARAQRHIVWYSTPTWAFNDRIPPSFPPTFPAPFPPNDMSSWLDLLASEWKCEKVWVKMLFLILFDLSWSSVALAFMASYYIFLFYGFYCLHSSWLSANNWRSSHTSMGSTREEMEIYWVLQERT